MTDLVTAFRERRIWRVLVAYPSVTFIWLQAVEFFINNYGFDERLLTVSLIVAIVLFPAAVVWNWAHGEEGSQSFSKAEIGAYFGFGVAAILAQASTAAQLSYSALCSLRSSVEQGCRLCRTGTRILLV